MPSTVKPRNHGGLAKRRFTRAERLAAKAVRLLIDPARHAAEARLVYISDNEPGIRRLRAGNGFHYVDAAGKPIRAPETLARIRALVIPPAWSDVWICARPTGHLQAVGRDACGRKQYRYHPRWREIRDETKYSRLILFARSLPRIRRRVRRDLRLAGLPRHKVSALLVRLLEETLLRIGNEEYARQNGSYGLTTLQDHHVEIRGEEVRFSFRGKSGVRHSAVLTDQRLARLIRQCHDLPGQELFQCVDDDGQPRAVGSGDVNDYLKAITGDDFTAKDFRTWAGTLLAARALCRLPPPQSKAEAKRKLAKVVAEVSVQLGNTRTVCRKCYIHPAVMAGYEDGSIGPAFTGLSGVRNEEKRLLRYLTACARQNRKGS
jgi:DNA topoisomerase-1